MWLSIAGVVVVSAALAQGRASVPAPAPEPARPVPASASQSNQFMLEVGAQFWRVDGTFAGFASTTGPSEIQKYIWVTSSPCMVASSENQPETATAGWRVSSRVLSQMADEFVVQVEWQRVWDQGEKLPSGPRGLRTLSLRPGTRVEFDRVAIPTTPGCAIAEARLQTSVIPNPNPTVVASRAGGGGRRGGAAPGMGVGGGSRGGRGGGAATSGQPANAPSALLTVLGTYDAELWLVHKLPDGSEEPQHQVVRFSSATMFTFPPVVVTTSQGSVAVDVLGKLTVQTTSTGPKLTVGVFRRTVSDKPPFDVGRGGEKDLTLPSPADVTSFEFPPLPKTAEDLLAGHQFSLRLRLTPAK